MGSRSAVSPGAANGASTGAAIVVNAMECREFQELLGEVLERANLPQPGQLHLAECAECAAILSDFEAIAQEVRLLAPEETGPVPDQWPQIRETLRREGLIHAPGEPCPPPASPKLVHSATTPRRGDKH